MRTTRQAGADQLFGSYPSRADHEFKCFARRELGGKECAPSARRRARPAYPSPGIDAYGPRCSISCTTAVCDGDAARRLVRAALMPAAVACASISDVGEL